MSRIYINNLAERVGSQHVAPRATPVYAPGRIDAREKVRVRAAYHKSDFALRWVIFTLLVLLTFGFCVFLNMRSHSELRFEQQQQSFLNAEIKQLHEANSSLLEDINNLQTDPATIERAARQRLKMVRANEQILVPAN